MAEKFNEILDDCINRITLRGETVESCLARYPQLASELEPYLRIVAQVGQTYTFAANGAAKERGRQRLQAEQLAIQHGRQEKMRRPVRGYQWNFNWFPRWATAVVVAVLAILVVGVGTVAASGNALPGNVLYPVKLGTEEVRLAFQPSVDGKTKLHMDYAERRAEEMAIMMKAGKTSQLEPLRERIHNNLTKATFVLGAVGNERSLASFRSQFQQSASRVLDNLQVAMQEAPEASRQEASDSFQASSQAYEQAVETVMARLPKPSTAAAPGTLQLLATDLLPPGMEKVLLTVGKIEVYLSAGEDSRWITITQEPQTLDLLQIGEVKEFLGQKEVEPGTYTKVRFHIDKATVVASGTQHPAKVPSRGFSLIRPFVVEEGKTTSVLLDFRGAHSLQVTGQGDFAMRPWVSMWVQRPGEQERRLGEESWRPVRDPGRHGMGLGMGRLDRARFEGPVEALAQDYLVVQGTRIVIAPTTRIEGKVEAGRQVEVEAMAQPDGSFLAIKVQRGK